jgi:hypothetical protein
LGDHKLITFQLSDLGWIRSVEYFIASFFRLRERIKNEKLLFRGHSKLKYPLLPSIGRRHEYGGRFKDFALPDEIQLFRRFKRRAYPHERAVLNTWEGLFLARHHGLPTRLLDWTANALFGLYFTCVKAPRSDGALWAFTRFRDNEGLDVLSRLESPEKELFELYEMDEIPVRQGRITKDAVKIIDPVYNSPRIVAQDGAFTFHSNPRRSLESYAGVLFKSENLDIDGLFRWKVPARRKPDIIAQLSGLGITHRIVFPDLDGIARSVWETEVLWRGTPTSPGHRKKPHSEK